MNEGEETNTYDPGYDTTLADGNTLDDIQVDSSGNISLRVERAALTPAAFTPSFTRHPTVSTVSLFIV